MRDVLSGYDSDEVISIRDIMAQRNENKTPGQRLAEAPYGYLEYTPKLYKNLTCPSYVHGYSIAIEYMKKWFMSKFPKDYFKYVYVNGKHVLDDWKHFNNYNIVREKPMLAIVPQVDYDNDREYRDAYLMDQTMFIKRSNFQQSFFKDYDFMNFLYLQMRELRMDFNFKIRVNSRAEQLDLFNRMELWFRIGSTQFDYVSADFHVPYDIMLNIAADSGFEVKNNYIVDPFGFVAYMNKHSDIPMIFKMRAINQKPEFFVRAKRMYTHIATIDKLQLDDGERQGKLDSNFHVEMKATLRIPIPHFYVYFCQDPITYKIGVHEPNNSIGIYDIQANEIPYYNDMGWGQIAITEYLADKDDIEIDLSPILNNGHDIPILIDRALELGIAPESFIDLKVLRGEDNNHLVEGIMDWKTRVFHYTYPERRDEMLSIVIYGDKQYINDTMSTIENYDNTRFNIDKDAKLN